MVDQLAHDLAVREHIVDHRRLTPAVGFHLGEPAGKLVAGDADIIQTLRDSHRLAGIDLGENDHFLQRAPPHDIPERLRTLDEWRRRRAVAGSLTGGGQQDHG